MADLDHDIAKAGEELERMDDEKQELEATITSLEQQIAESKTSLEELLAMRNEESERFKAALKDDADAVAIIAKAIVAISKFYKDNKIPLELMQHKKEDPKYSVDEDKAPDATFSDSGSRNSES